MNVIPASFRSAAGYAAVMADYQRILAKWTIPYEEMVVPTRFGETHILVSGAENAPPLVVLHGMGINAASWGLNVPAWAGDYRVYAPDIVGEGGKSAGTRLRRDGVQDTLWLQDVFDALHIERAHVAGISLGGWLTLMFALHMPERVDRIVLLCPATLIPLKLEFMLYGVRASVHPSKQNVRRVLHYMAARRTEVDDDILHSLEILFRHTRLNTRLPRAFSDDDLRRIQAHALLLIGEREVIYDPNKAMMRAQRLMPQVCAEIIPGTGHAINIEQAEWVNQRVLRFLKDGV